MKKHSSNIIVSAICLLAALSLYADYPNGKACKTTPDSTDHTCSGTPPCGSVTDVKYTGCTDCRTGTEKDDCTDMAQGFSCTREQRVTPCVPSGGGCINGTPGKWTTDYPLMKYCGN